MGAPLILLALSLTSARSKGTTFDEGAHIPAGYTYVSLGDFRLNPEHPPLAKIMAGLPLLFLKPRIDTHAHSWVEASEWEFGVEFLYEWNDADKLIFVSRIPLVLLCVLLGFCVHLCSRALYGWQAGCLAFLLYVFNPDILAHGQLVTSDLALTCFLFTAVYLFHRTVHYLNVWNVLLTGVAIGLCLSSKFTGILVFPILALVGIAFAASDAMGKLSLFGGRVRSDCVTTLRGKLAMGTAILAASVPIALAVLWACYGFRYLASPDPRIASTMDLASDLARQGRLAMPAQSALVLRLLPSGYTYGFVQAMQSIQNRPAYLLGECLVGGCWYYFVITLLVKTPIPLLVLIVLALFFTRRYGAGLAGESMLLIPAASYFLFATALSLNVGHRHILPIYPFLIAFASKLARGFDWSRLAILKAIIILLLGWNILETLWIYPHFLAYFNQIAGGPSGGYRVLTDSNLDWGQDLKALAEYRQVHPEEPFYLSYFGSAIPEYYGLHAHVLPGLNTQMAEKAQSKQIAGFDDIPSGAIVAISATNLSGVYFYYYPDALEFVQYLQDLEPIDRIGYSIFVYRMP